MKATWKPHDKSGPLTGRSDLPDSVYAFPKQRKEPLTDARHVRNAIARLDQVEDVTDSERELAFANIQKAAEHYGVVLSETSAADVGVHPQSAANKSKRASARTLIRNKSSAKKSLAKKGAAKKGTSRKGTSKKGTSKNGAAKKGAAKKGAAKRSGSTH